VQLLSQMTALDPDHRPSAGTVGEQLRALAAQPQLSPLAPTAIAAGSFVTPNDAGPRPTEILPAVAARRSRYRSAPLIAAAAVAILAAGALGIDALTTAGSTAGSGSPNTAPSTAITHKAAAVTGSPRPTTFSRARSGTVTNVGAVTTTAKHPATKTPTAAKRTPPGHAKKAPTPPGPGPGDKTPPGHPKAP
jgi:hypothetical protein